MHPLRECYKLLITRMHSSKMHTAHALPHGGLCPLTETPRDRDPGQRPPCRETPCTETPMVMWPVVHARTETSPPCEQNDWQTGVKTLPCRNFVAGGKNVKFTLHCQTINVRMWDCRNIVRAFKCCYLRNSVWKFVVTSMKSLARNLTMIHWLEI